MNKLSTTRTTFRAKRARSTVKLFKSIPRTAPCLRLNNICPYYTMFPLEFPIKALSHSRNGEWVFDPFCGRGTTIYAARLLGLRSIGFDSNPVAAAVAKSKLVSVSAGAISKLCKKILRKKTPEHIPRTAFWKLAFHRKTLEELCRLREYFLKSCESPEEIALRAIILGILHGPKNKGLPTYLSNQMPRTYATKPEAALIYWIRNKLTPDRVDVLDAVFRRAAFTFSELPPYVEGKVFHENSKLLNQKLNGHAFDLVITSPPYYGMRSYIPDQWLRNWFLGGPNTVEYSHEGQISHKGHDAFISDLAEIWRKTGKFCRKKSRLIIRFGALPSENISPSDILKKSLAQAECGWEIRTIRDAGYSTNGRRQSEQFSRSISRPICEVDVYATLEA